MQRRAKKGLIDNYPIEFTLSVTVFNEFTRNNKMPSTNIKLKIILITEAKYWWTLIVWLQVLCPPPAVRGCVLWRLALLLLRSTSCSAEARHTAEKGPVDRAPGHTPLHAPAFEGSKSYFIINASELVSLHKSLSVCSHMYILYRLKIGY